MKKIALLISIHMLTACHTNAVKVTENPVNSEVMSEVKSEIKLTPAEVVAQSKSNEWRLLDAENTLYMQLDQGLVIIELMPLLAPKHVENTKALVRQSIFDNTNFYRVIDGFVAQGGPMFESEADKTALKEGQYSIPSELTSNLALGKGYTQFDDKDGFADETGFLKSFPVGRDFHSGESWLLHCYGALGMGRGNELDSGGTELYIVNGGAQRYLDRNVTVFGRVIDGMPHIQGLKRGSNLNGAVDLTGQNIIQSIQVAADLPASEVLPIEVMRSDSASFKQLLKARKNRTGEWFTFQHNYIDACGVPIPVRLVE